MQKNEKTEGNEREKILRMEVRKDKTEKWKITNKNGEQRGG